MQCVFGFILSHPILGLLLFVHSLGLFLMRFTANQTNHIKNIKKFKREKCWYTHTHSQNKKSTKFKIKLILFFVLSNSNEISHLRIYTESIILAMFSHTYQPLYTPFSIQNSPSSPSVQQQTQFKRYEFQHPFEFQLCKNHKNVPSFSFPFAIASV